MFGTRLRVRHMQFYVSLGMYMLIMAKLNDTYVQLTQVKHTRILINPILADVHQVISVSRSFHLQMTGTTSQHLRLTCHGYKQLSR